MILEVDGNRFEVKAQDESKKYTWNEAMALDPYNDWRLPTKAEWKRMRKEAMKWF
jgi:uncharacterized protein (TIGR02145 family)